MTEEIEEQVCPIDFRFSLLLFQAAMFSVLIFSAIILRFFGGNFYKTVRNEYIKYFEKETDIRDVFSPMEDYSSFDEGYTVIVE